MPSSMLTAAITPVSISHREIPLQWRHNDRDGVSNHQPQDCLLNRICKAQIKKKHQSSASLAFVMEIHRWPVNSTHKGPVTRNMFRFHDVIMQMLYWQLYRHWRHLKTIQLQSSTPSGGGGGGGQFSSIKMSSHQYWDSSNKDKTIARRIFMMWISSLALVRRVFILNWLTVTQLISHFKKAVTMQTKNSI